jgi:hypothetical protein
MPPVCFRSLPQYLYPLANHGNQRGLRHERKTSGLVTLEEFIIAKMAAY